MTNEVIKFIRQKDYKLISHIGQGGTGKTVLLEDETISERFVCKKYEPFFEEHKLTFFNNFKEEIKILHFLNHENVVRVFNYYLYPEHTTGYILMEFIDGFTINEFIKNNPENLNDIFSQIINGFTHLERYKILHRDIRPENILVSKTGVAKIIDFGFGKKINFDLDFEKSISLNWRYTPPLEFNQKIYNFQTEIYFVGKLFEEIITDNEIDNFYYEDIIKKMVQLNPLERFESFFDVSRALIQNTTNYINFENEEIEVYQNFANSIKNIIHDINFDTIYIDDIALVLRKLKELHQNSVLEHNINNPNKVILCFIKGGFSYKTNPFSTFQVQTLKEFIDLLDKVPVEKQQIILNHLWERFDSVKNTYKAFDEDIPF